MPGRGDGFGGRGCGGQGGISGQGHGSCGECICPQCSETAPHQRGVPCQDMKCPKCGSPMIRKN